MSTDALSLDPPTAQEEKLSQTLQEQLEKENIFDTPEELKHRQLVIAKLNELATQWVVKISKEKYSMPADIAATQIALVFTFGSYRLGVHARGGDIDTLICVPIHIKREDFFDSFYAILKDHPSVKDLHAAEGAHVPAIKLEFDGIEIDLLVAVLSFEKLSTDLNLKDDTILKNLNDVCARSVNGRRVTDAILDLVPNHNSFRLALRAIKLWAKRRAVSANVLGYMGGVHLAILVAKVCQMYPNATGSVIVDRFFWVYNNWGWPKPVLLREFQDLPYGFVQWDPRTNPYDKLHLMPIITPAYPQMNASFNVTVSTRDALSREFERGHNLMHAVFGGTHDWSVLWKPSTFFVDYKRFLSVSALAATEDELLEYEGLVESCVRHFMLELEKTPPVAFAVPFPKGFHVNPELPEEERAAELEKAEPSPKALYKTVWYIGLCYGDRENMVDNKPGPAPRMKLDPRPAATVFYERVQRRSATMTRHTPSMNVKVEAVLRQNLPDYVFPNGRPPMPKKVKNRQGPKTPSEPRTKRAKLETPQHQPVEELSARASPVITSPTSANFALNVDLKKKKQGGSSNSG